MRRSAIACGALALSLLGAFGASRAMSASERGNVRAPGRNSQLSSRGHLPSEPLENRARGNSGAALTLVLDQLAAETPAAVAPKSRRHVSSSAALSQDQLTALISKCAPGTPNTLVRSIVGAESGAHPFRLATNGVTHRTYDPRSLAEAKATLLDLLARNENVDVGLMQLNSASLARRRVSATDALDPCRNITVGAAIFDQDYAAAMRRRTPTSPLWAASSLYNTGDAVRGLRNGYVSRINAGLHLVRQPVGAS